MTCDCLNFIPFLNSSAASGYDLLKCNFHHIDSTFILALKYNFNRVHIKLQTSSDIKETYIDYWVGTIMCEYRVRKINKRHTSKSTRIQQYILPIDKTCATKSRWISYDLLRWRRVLGKIRGEQQLLTDAFSRDAFIKHTYNNII